MLDRFFFDNHDGDLFDWASVIGSAAGGDERTAVALPGDISTEPCGIAFIGGRLSSAGIFARIRHKGSDHDIVGRDCALAAFMACPVDTHGAPVYLLAVTIGS